jgi:hypothetical protein
MRQRVEFDLDYLRNWTLWLDVRENPAVPRFAPIPAPSPTAPAA